MRFGALLLCGLAVEAAAAPMSLRHQGRVVDASGTAISGTRDVTVALYAASTGGTALWSKTYTGVAIDGGYYGLDLSLDDEGDAIRPAWVAAGAWLETSVSGVGALTPRQRVGDVPSAGLARAVALDSAATAGVCDASRGGETYFDAGEGSLLVCDGSNWIAAAGGSGGPPDRTATWTTQKSGDLACTQLDGICLSAKNSSNAPIACNAFVTAGSADCRGARVDADGWSFHVSYTGSQSNGILECARSNANCVAGYRASDALVTTCADIRGGASSGPMIYRCKPATDAVDGWNFGVLRTSGSITGNEACAQVGRACKDIVRGYDNIVDHCDSSRGASGDGNNIVARCRERTGADPWTAAFVRSSGNYTGNTLCTQENMACVDVVRADGIHEGCDVERGGSTGTPVVARCRAKVPADLWTVAYSWSSGSHTGNTMCTLNDAVCVDVVRADSLHEGCNSERGGSVGYPVFARCRARTASDPWDTWRVWSGGDSNGNAQCSAIGGTCVDVIRGDSLITNCTENRGGSASYPAIARCNLP